MNGKQDLISAHADFLEDQLMQTQQNLFFARTVREVKFLQLKIFYLKKQMKETKKNKKEK